MKAFMIIIASVAMVLSSTSKASEKKGIGCAFGVPGFNSEDPSLLLSIYNFMIPFNEGTEQLATKGTGSADKEEAIKIVSKTTEQGQLFSFEAIRPEGKGKFTVTVNDKPFTGKFAGLPADAAKEAKEAKAKMSVSDSGGTEDVEVDGFCFVIK